MGHPQTLNVYGCSYQGLPGAGILSESAIRLECGETVQRQPTTTTAALPAPEAYLLLVQPLHSSFPSLCCWTNEHVQMTVVA